MEELLLELLDCDSIEMEVVSEWAPLQQQDRTFWDRFWWTGETEL